MADAPDGRRGGRRRGRRLSRSADFDRVYRDGRSQANRFLVVYSFPRASADDGPRLGVSVGRKVGGAVVRNRVKRLLREAFWACSEDLGEQSDYVVLARAPIAELAAEKGETGVEEALRSVLLPQAPGAGSEG